MTDRLYSPPFGRVLKLGSVGRDVQGMKRALARAGGKMMPALGSTSFGQKAVTDVRRFQQQNGLHVDGVYGPRTHEKLSPYFDGYAFLLYTGRKPPPVVSLQLPEFFIPTHQTAGLPGYPAVDVFAQAGTAVLAPADGIVRRCSGHNPNDGGTPGGAYGWSIYLKAAHGEYFLTHLGTRYVTEGTEVARGELIGTVCDAAVAHMPSILSHVHEGLKTL